jgi:hypothetical protein
VLTEPKVLTAPHCRDVFQIKKGDLISQLSDFGKVKVGAILNLDYANPFPRVPAGPPSTGN